MKHDPRSSSLIIACFDGHGDYGHDVSRFCKSYIEKELVAHPLFLSNLKGAILDVTHALGKNGDEEEEKEKSIKMCKRKKQRKKQRKEERD